MRKSLIQSGDQVCDRTSSDGITSREGHARDDDDERERDHGQKSWSERGTKGASQAANATNEKNSKKTRGTTVRHNTSSKLHHNDMRG